MAEFTKMHHRSTSWEVHRLRHNSSPEVVPFEGPDAEARARLKALTWALEVDPKARQSYAPAHFTGECQVVEVERHEANRGLVTPTSAREALVPLPTSVG